LKYYAFLEIGLGFLILINPAVFSLFDKLYGLLYPHLFQNFVLLSLVRLLFVTVILLPPTILIGGTLPLFCRQYVTREQKILFSVGQLYGLNTLGAVAGTVVCGFVMIPFVGVNQTIWICGILNIIIGVIVRQLGLTAFTPLPDGDKPPVKIKKPSVKAKEVQNNSPGNHDNRLIAILFLLSGFVFLGNEIIWTRYLSLIIQNTVYIYTLTLTVILVGIFLGSTVISIFPKVTWQRIAFLFSLTHILIGLSVTVVLMLPADFWKDVIDTQHISTILWISALIFLFPSLLSGMSFPLAIRLVVRQPDHAGIGVGRMSAINTVGGISGSLAVGFLALPLLGLYKSVIMTTGMSLCIGFVAVLFLNKTVHFAIKSVIIGVTLIAWIAIPKLTETRLPGDFLAERSKLIDFREGINSFLSVVKMEQEDLVLEINRMWQGGTQKGHQILAAHVPMILHLNPQKVLSIGVGVGQTTSRFLYYDIKQLDCIDIENELFDILRKHFDSEWMDDDRVRLIVEDGRNFIAHTDNKYDVISIEIGQIFRPNLASFYTAEFYKCIRERLNDKGIVSQFVPLAFLERREFIAIIRTFLELFPESVLWFNRNELLLIGSNRIQPVLTSGRLALLNDSAINTDLKYYFWGGPENQLNKPEVFTAGFLCGPETLKRLCGNSFTYHDNKPILEYQSATKQKHAVDDIAKKIELLREYLDPLPVIIAEKKYDTLLSRIDYTRDYNLKNNIAMGLFMTYLESNNVNLLYKAYKWNPYNVDITFKMGVVCSKGGKIREAERYFNEVIQIDPEYTDAYSNLGLMLANQGSLSEAVNAYLKAIQLDPQHVKAYNNLGIAYAKQGLLREAVRCFSKALEIKPDFQSARKNLQTGLKKLSEIERKGLNK
jgi:spermidine synthase